MISTILSSSHQNSNKYRIISGRCQEFINLFNHANCVIGRFNEESSIIYHDAPPVPQTVPPTNKAMGGVFQESLEEALNAGPGFGFQSSTPSVEIEEHIGVLSK